MKGRCLACLAGAASVASSASAQDGGEQIEPLGWSRAGATEDAELLYRSGPDSPGDLYDQSGRRVSEIQRLWIRYEQRKPLFHRGMSYRSLVVLDEFDCTRGRVHSLQGTVYAQPNLRGEARTATVEAQWQYAMPGTINELFLGIACSAGR